MYTYRSRINRRLGGLRAVCIAITLLGTSSVAIAGLGMNANRSGAPGSGFMTKGGTLTLRGTGFTPGQRVEAYFSDHPNPSQRGTSTAIGVANSSGSVSVSLPTNNWRLGRYSASLRQPGKVSNTAWIVLYDGATPLRCPRRVYLKVIKQRSTRAIKPLPKRSIFCCKNIPTTLTRR